MKLPDTKYRRLYWSKSKKAWQAIEAMPTPHLHNAAARLREELREEVGGDETNDPETLQCLEAEIGARALIEEEV